MVLLLFDYALTIVAKPTSGDVNWLSSAPFQLAAMLRLKHLVCQDPTWGSTSDLGVISPRSVIALHAAVLWNPKQSYEGQFIIKVRASLIP